jgi:hypothetical protein
VLPLAQADTQEEIVQRLARRRFLSAPRRRAHGMFPARTQVMLRRQADADADGRGDDLDETGPTFSDPCNI